MGEFSIWHWLIVLLVVMLLFGSGKVSNLMGDFAKGIKSFKKNMADDHDDTPVEASREPPSAEIADRDRQTEPQRERETTAAH